MKKQWRIVAAVAVAGLVLAWVLSGDDNSTDGQAFRLAPVSRGKIRATVSSTGTLNPLNTVQVDSQVSVKTAEANLKRAIAQQEGTRALIAQRKASRHLAEIQLDYCTIRSPIGGTVISRHVDVGQTVAASLQSPILFTTAEDLSRMQVEVDVSEADVGQIRAEQPVEFTVDAFPEKKFKARVRQVRNAANSVQNVVTYTI